MHFKDITPVTDRWIHCGDIQCFHGTIRNGIQTQTSIWKTHSQRPLKILEQEIPWYSGILEDAA